MKNIGISEIARIANVSIETAGRALLNRKGVSGSTRQSPFTNPFSRLTAILGFHLFLVSLNSH